MNPQHKHSAPRKSRKKKKKKFYALKVNNFSPDE